MAQTLYSYGWYFFLYAFLGWCGEVIFAARKGKFVNRGFLNGPICPIYGAGIVLVTAILAPVRDNVLWLYVGSAVLTSAVELVTGFVMEKLFHHRWWDYSKQPLNIGGYICLPFSLLWGVACVAIVDGFHPLIERFVRWIPHTLGWVLLAVFAGAFLADCIVTVLTVAKLNRRLAQIDEAAKRLRSVSDNLGAGLAEGAIPLWKKGEALHEEGEQRLEKGKERLAQEKAKLEQLQKEKLGLSERRLLKAFPEMRSLRHKEALEALKKELSARRPSRKGKKHDADKTA